MVCCRYVIVNTLHEGDDDDCDNDNDNDDNNNNNPYSGFPQAMIYPETQGFAIAIQDRVMKPRNYEKHCLEGV
jgi:hypothetical protein